MAVGVAVVLVLVAVAVSWHTRVGFVRQSLQSAAFSTTFAAALFLVTGTIGFSLRRGPSLLSDARWSETVIWPQVGLGIAFSIAAVLCWPRALRDVERRVGRQVRSPSAHQPHPPPPQPTVPMSRRVH
jgi:hypothetical protein